MSASGCIRWTLVGLVVSLSVAHANDSGPGPGSGQTGREYNVLVLRMGRFDQGTMSFSGSTSGSPDGGSIMTTGNTTTGTTGAGNDQTGVTANPAATGDASPILPGSFGSGNIAGNTSGSTTVNTPGTTTNGVNTGATTGSTEPASYWTTARANGQVSGNTSDPNSSDYWTHARVNGRDQTSASGGFGNGGGGGGIASSVATGDFTASFSNSQTSGNWYSIDLGSFALWFATGDSAQGTVTFAGYATPETIAGRTSVGTGGFFEALFTGAFFVGQATDNPSGDDAGDSTMTEATP